MKSNIFHVNIFMILLVAVVMSGCSGNIDRIIISDDVNTSEAGSDSLSASGEAPEESVSSQSQNEAGENAEPQDVYVYVCGEVAVPGVYILKSDSRIYDAICMAGGFTENAAEG